MIEPVFADRLSHRVLRGGFWVFSIRLVDQLLYLVRLTILARLLAPRDFGLMGIAMLSLAIMETFSQTGFQAALIQRKDNPRDYLDSAWTVMILRAAVIFALLFLLAPAAASFFGSPAAKPIIQVFGISVLLRALTNIGVIHFQKDLEFNRQFLFEVSGILTNFTVMVVLAFVLRNVWALLLGMVARHAVQLVVSYAIHPYRPRLRIDRDKVSELFGFGKWVLGSTILVFLVTQGDDIFVGKFLGTAMLGFYQLAYKISNTPTTEISHVIATVTFPTYAKLQDDLPRLREAYLKVLQMTAFLAAPLAAFIFVLAPDFITVFLGQKWMPMSAAMQALALAGLVRAVVGTTGPLFHGMGLPRVETTWELVRFVVLAVMLYPMTSRWGLLGASLAVFVSLFVSCLGFSWNAVRLTRLKPGDFARALAFPLLCASLSAGVIWEIKTALSPGLGSFLLAAAAGAGAYGLLAAAMGRLFGYSTIRLVKETLSSLIRPQSLKPMSSGTLNRSGGAEGSRRG